MQQRRSAIVQPYSDPIIVLHKLPLNPHGLPGSRPKGEDYDAAPGANTPDESSGRVNADESSEPDNGDAERPSRLRRAAAFAGAMVTEAAVPLKGTPLEGMVGKARDKALAVWTTADNRGYIPHRFNDMFLALPSYLGLGQSTARLSERGKLPSPKVVLGMGILAIGAYVAYKGYVSLDEMGVSVPTGNIAGDASPIDAPATSSTQAESPAPIPSLPAEALTAEIGNADGGDVPRPAAIGTIIEEGENVYADIARSQGFDVNSMTSKEAAVVGELTDYAFEHDPDLIGVDSTEVQPGTRVNLPAEGVLKARADLDAVFTDIADGQQGGSGTELQSTAELTAYDSQTGEGTFTYAAHDHLDKLGLKVTGSQFNQLLPQLLDYDKSFHVIMGQPVYAPEVMPMGYRAAFPGRAVLDAMISRIIDESNKKS